MFDKSDQELTLFLAGCTLARVPGNQNWLEEKAVGGLPDYICRIARAIHQGDASKSISQVIAIAVSRTKVWAAGGGGVTAKTRAKAAKAVAEWEEKKKAAKLDNKVKASNSENDVLNLSSYNVDDVRRQYRESYPSIGTNAPYKYIREMWSDYLIVSVDADGQPETYVKVPYTVDSDGKATFGDEVPVKQSYAELSNLECPLTDSQLELAALIPCTEKANRSLLDNVKLAHQLRMEQQDLLKMSAPVLKLISQRDNRKS